MKNLQSRSGCPISYSLDFIGDKWSLLIIRDMIFSDKKSYNEFLDSDEGIATNILGNRLKFLESEGFIIKRDSPIKKSKKNYFLTEKGIALIPIIFEMVLWGKRFSPTENQNKVFDEIEENKAEYILKSQQKLREQLKREK
ncbi:winged helix-turn-helix transcriptional regulator [Sinomicrobium soli]|uniref:winged helix-turn-helix transcriptional regulator n=1 Tax=Sinomicrobium sp. N-1-3-6 TaxID=2219864 RepID=UPI000DCBE7FC|nr:helix-turn-helix domain-containing protein [Sinomicrobium sp. N-1-3-6]RAV27781.1 transcriptional regulator [Sinomicrobium sp. N-1-3-6]